MFVLIFRCEAFDGQRGGSVSELGENRRSPNWHGRRQFLDFELEESLALMSGWDGFVFHSKLRGAPALMEHGYVSTDPEETSDSSGVNGVEFVMIACNQGRVTNCSKR